ncbi:MAG: SCO family protein [Pyrinomonadaceae bacterium]|nr:SCO family protein [Pyrinomonadaceae bacterium]
MSRKSSIFSVLRITINTVLCIFLISVIGFGQRIEHYNSPLYSPKVYDPNQAGTSNGLPKTLDEVGIKQKLNEQIPLDTEVKDENGKTVKIGEYFGKRPVILALVYYECPMLCSEVLNGLTGTLKGLNFSAGKEFDVIALSFDARENDKPELAKNKKVNYLQRYGREGSENGWHFLTATQDSIDKITNAVGFGYKWDEQTQQFAHAGAIMVLTPDGRMSKYLYGIDYAPKDVKLALIESSENKIGTPVDQLLLYCYHYNPATGKYGLQILNVIRLGGILTLLGLGTMFFVFWRRNKNKNNDFTDEIVA